MLWGDWLSLLSSYFHLASCRAADPCMQVEVHNASDVVTLMARGASQRATSETKMNDRSSRSHQILTVIVDGFNSVTKASSHGCLHLIDLAGSERVGKSEASGESGCLVCWCDEGRVSRGAGSMPEALAAGMVCALVRFVQLWRCVGIHHEQQQMVQWH